MIGTAHPREKSAPDFVDTSIHNLTKKRWAESHVLESHVLA